MSKSLGNIKLVNDILKYSGNVSGLSLLSSHYRQPMDWSEKILEQSKTLMRFKKVTSKYQVRKNEKNITKDKNMKDFLDALYDDLNTPKVLAIINGWFDKFKKTIISKFSW